MSATDNGKEDTRAVAERLAAELHAATGLVLLDVLSVDLGDASTSRTTPRTGDNFADQAR